MATNCAHASVRLAGQGPLLRHLPACSPPLLTQCLGKERERRKVKHLWLITGDKTETVDFLLLIRKPVLISQHTHNPCFSPAQLLSQGKLSWAMLCC